MPAAPSCLVHAAANEKAMQPGIEAVRVAKRREVPPGTHKGVLDRILGPVRPVEDQPRDRIEPGENGMDERGEGVMIASSRPVHELSLHVPPSIPPRAVAATDTPQADGCPATVPIL